jgi:phosphoesterase RecJ-like protein
VLDWTPFVDLVRRYGHFLLTTHVRPDGDGLGSMLALADVLQRQGKDVQMVIASVMPPRYQFLDPGGRIKRIDMASTWRRGDPVFILDTGTWNQLGDFGPFLRSCTGPRLVIDHHQTQDDLGGVCLADTTAEATGRLVFEAIHALGEPLSEHAANMLFVAIAMDTGWFRHANTTAKTFVLAAELMQAGARPDILYRHLFEENSVPRLRLLGLVLERLQVASEGKVAHSEIHRDDYASTGAVPQDTEDLVNYMRSVAGVEVALFFMEQPHGGVKVSFRSTGLVDVARIAEEFGGGGHRLASGAVVEGTLPEVRARVLEAVAAALQDG